MNIVDTALIKGQFLLVGSVDIFRTVKVPDSLVGRVLSLTLPPLTSAEILKSATSKLIDWAFDNTSSNADVRCDRYTRADIIELILRGDFPSIRELPADERKSAQYDQVGQDMDLDIIHNVKKPDRFRQIIKMMAKRTATETSPTFLSKSLNLSRETVDFYLGMLIRLSILIRLDAWSSSECHREIKHPKYHIVDSGMACLLRNFDNGSFENGQKPTAFAPIFESYVVNEFLRVLLFQQDNYRAYHWRSPEHRAIDLIIERDRDVLGIEIKAAMDFDSNDLSDLRSFAKRGPGRNRRFASIMIYLGS